MQRQATLLPAFDQSPVHRTKHEVLTAPPNKRVFDFREIREVVQDGVSGLRFQVSGSTEELETWNLKLFRPIINQTHPLKRQRLIDLVDVFRSARNQRRQSARCDYLRPPAKFID